MSLTSSIKSVVDYLQWKMSEAAAKHEAALRPMAERTSISHKGYIRAVYLSATAFCLGVFPMVYTPEAGFMHDFSLATMGFSWVTFAACVVYMVIYRVGVDNGWIDEKGNALAAQPAQVVSIASRTRRPSSGHVAVSGTASVYSGSSTGGFVDSGFGGSLTTAASDEKVAA